MGAVSGVGWRVRGGEEGVKVGAVRVVVANRSAICSRGSQTSSCIFKVVLVQRRETGEEEAGEGRGHGAWKV